MQTTSVSGHKLHVSHLHQCCEYLSSLTFMLSGTRILRAFLIIGWGLSSSSLKECLRGSKFCSSDVLDIAMSEESMSNIPITSGPFPVGVSRGGQEDEEEEEGDSQESSILLWLPRIKKKINLSTLNTLTVLVEDVLTLFDRSATKIKKYMQHSMITTRWQQRATLLIKTNIALALTKSWLVFSELSLADKRFHSQGNV